VQTLTPYCSAAKLRDREFLPPTSSGTRVPDIVKTGAMWAAAPVAPDMTKESVVLQVVCIKQVPDTETRVKVAADGVQLDSAGVTWVMNPYDEYAVEEALRIREKAGAGEVVALTLGGPGVTSTLRNALAMGADRAIHLTHDGSPPDPLQIARALAAELQPLGAQIVWFGRQAVDDDAAQVGPIVAEMLGIPCVTAVAKFELNGETAKVEREIEGGREVLEVRLPAAFTADKGLNEPRYASLKGIMAAKKKTIDAKPAAPGEPSLEVLALELPPARGAGRVVGEGPAAVAELVRVLREEAKVI
jgi:electron transfer flavoprotein beta subunit